VAYYQGDLKKGEKCTQQQAGLGLTDINSIADGPVAKKERRSSGPRRGGGDQVPFCALHGPQVCLSLISGRTIPADHAR